MFSPGIRGPMITKKEKYCITEILGSFSIRKIFTNGMI